MLRILKPWLVKISKWYFRVFLEWVIPVVLFTFIMFILTFYKNGFINFFSRNSDFNYKILYITLPSIILVIVTVLISLKTPVITQKSNSYFAMVFYYVHF